MKYPISLHSVDVQYKYPGAGREALQGITCSLKSGEIVGLAGLSASGKSTLGRLFKGLLEPDCGKFLLTFEGNDQRSAFARDRLEHVGWAGAHPENQLFAASVSEEVAFGPRNQGISGNALDACVEMALDLVGLQTEKYQHKHFLSLSGGERRRLALAGVISMRCVFYVFDEPTAGLDFKGCGDFVKLVKRLKAGGSGVLWITHDIPLLQATVDRLWVLEKGRLACDLTAEKVDWDDFSEKLVKGETFLEWHKEL